MPKKQFIGVIASDKMQKTAVVAVKAPKVHPLYHKRYYRNRRFKVQNDVGAVIGDRVQIIETRPLSKEKRWRIVKIVDRKESK